MHPDVPDAFLATITVALPDSIRCSTNGAYNPKHKSVAWTVHGEHRSGTLTAVFATSTSVKVRREHALACC